MAIRQPRPHLDEGDGPSRFSGKRMSEAAFLALPEVKPYLEYVDGVVRQKPMVNDQHGDIVAEIAFAFGLYRRAQLGHSRVEMRFRLPDGSFRLPDASFYAAGVPHGADAVPSVAVEVCSPGQRMSDLREKCRALRRAGVDTCWLIDPRARTAELFEGERDGQRVTILESIAMPAFSLTLDELFKVLDA